MYIHGQLLTYSVFRFSRSNINYGIHDLHVCCCYQNSSNNILHFNIYILNNSNEKTLVLNRCYILSIFHIKRKQMYHYQFSKILVRCFETVWQGKLTIIYNSLENLHTRTLVHYSSLLPIGLDN